MKVTSDTRPSNHGHTQAGGDQAADLANKIYRFRRRRGEIFPPEIFAEPAWDILLDLMIARSGNYEPSVSSVCVAADVPHSTGLRWIRALESLGFIERTPSDTDKRVFRMRLSDDGFEKMHRILATF